MGKMNERIFQSLGRLHRSIPMVVHTYDLSVEEKICKRINDKIIMLGISDPVEGLDLHKEFDILLTVKRNKTKKI